MATLLWRVLVGSGFEKALSLQYCWAFRWSIYLKSGACPRNVYTPNHRGALARTKLGHSPTMTDVHRGALARTRMAGCEHTNHRVRVCMGTMPLLKSVPCCRTWGGRSYRVSGQLVNTDPVDIWHYSMWPKPMRTRTIYWNVYTSILKYIYIYI